MIYRDVKSGALYQYVGAGWMALTEPLNSARRDPVVLARDPNGRNHVYAQKVYFPEHWTVRGEATLVADAGGFLLNDDEVVIYRDDTGLWFVAPAGEFFDGRHVAFSG